MLCLLCWCETSRCRNTGALLLTCWRCSPSPAEPQTLATELQRERQQAAGSESASAAAEEAAAGHGASAVPEPDTAATAAAAGEAIAAGPRGSGGSFDSEADERLDTAAAAAAAAAATGAAEREGVPHDAPVDPAHLNISTTSHEPDPAHLPSSYSAPWAAQHVPGSNGGASSPGASVLASLPGRRSSHGRHHESPAAGQPQGQGRQDEDGWQLVTDQAAARKLQGAALLGGARELPPYCREREGFRNSEHALLA